MAPCSKLYRNLSSKSSKDLSPLDGYTDDFFATAATDGGGEEFWIRKKNAWLGDVMVVHKFRVPRLTCSS